ncbi:MAG: pantoate--beta-alanine ligase [Desulfuromonadaceae bacterium]|nr:pantoate--beta-alanine ligase [Desulfuromonadaceae bacterium]
MTTPSLETIADAAAMQQRCLAARRAGQTIAFVPTMGYLHEGHLSLLRAGRERGELLILSIFVNPTQFGPNEDLASYPRDLERDLAVAAEAGVDLVFLPTPEIMYPLHYATYVTVEGVTEGLCGANRPGHFRGVTTVVCKLFNIVQPDVALFGQKDFQQLAVIRRMTSDLNLPVEIVGMPIVREADGLAMSSRNVYLSTEERNQALALIDALRIAAAGLQSGQQDAQSLIALATDRIRREPLATIDYIEIRDAVTLRPVTKIVTEGEAVMLMAVKVGNTRLLDNHTLSQPL